MRIAAVWLSALFLVLVPATAAAASPQPPRIFLSLGNGHALAFKVEGETTSILALATEVRCVVPAESAEGPVVREIEGFRAPTLLRPSPTGLQAIERTGRVFDSGSVSVDEVVVDGTTIVGQLEAAHAGEGEASCQTGDPSVSLADTAIPFEAVEFVPASDPRAGTPYPKEVPFYYGRTPSLEVYTWANSEYLLGIRGRAAPECEGPVPKKRGMRASLFDRPLHAGLVGHQRFRVVEEFRGRGDPPLTESTVLTGELTGEAIDGTFFRHESGRNKHGRWRCEVPRTAYEAVRYVPAAISAPAG
jgi:hypothetical protein